MATTTTLPLSTNPVLRSFQRFARMEASGGILLMVCAVIALIWANSPLAESYTSLFGTTVTVGAGSLVISKPLILWINDGLMAIFFFVVGLEIKRELLVGELTSLKAAALPIAAAIGGMVVPALFYMMLNAGTPGAAGWGIPMATDIAFALGVLALLGSRAPLVLKIFLTAVAIVDDLGAVLVIAFFYTAEVKMMALLVAAGFMVALVVLNVAGVRRPMWYGLLGIGLWVAFLKSGVHATLAGVLLALTIPATRKVDAGAFLAKAKAAIASFADAHAPGRRAPTSEQLDAVYDLEVACEDVETPLQRLEHGLHPFVAFFIVPVFALANAGVVLGGGLGEVITSPVTLGVVLGLVLGKQIGVLAFAWGAVKLGWAVLPAGVTWRQLYGVACLCGIGFTMSLFIANLAFVDLALIDAAKVGILAASVVSGIIGWLVLAKR